ncbi:GNAT family N-acetyltransferase [Thermoflavimicrobium dichotomicum]|uniref:Protein N-acetyltransferase, RimJ/RimL family n=1 Tax=Thermoflavimicrobium dichotomicum TaxID=46223 RepID=A0A1I3UMT9_9BACL|nr:GNAT family protein [Thermoflavimicrobium dichotomicum]SFJ84768.1 Protein N-acetyltransferase, RimJ/RimL family [Thermoflavimicrobium dichotomicum]
MEEILFQTKNLKFRCTNELDVSFLLEAENHPENAPFIQRWEQEKHIEAIHDPDIKHLIIESQITANRVGFVILAGLSNPHQSIEFRRIVITEKGKGYGREALRAVKYLSFEVWNAHRLWLDVKEHNIRARTLYRSEGFVEEGLLREAFKNGDQFESLVIMSMLKKEYQKCNKK